MSLGLVSLILVAAVMHASWNALLKNNGDRLRSIVIMTIAAALASLPGLLLVPLPDLVAGKMMLLSCGLHAAYNFALVRAYRYGDLGQIYPVARGTSPLAVTLGGLLIAGEHPAPMALAGIGLVCCGMFGLARGWSRARAGLPAALLTGCLIASYTVADGLGARQSGSPVGYSLVLFALDAIPLALVYAVLERRGRAAPLLRLDRDFRLSALGGLVSLLAYTAVIWAASRAPLGPVSALRETSVVAAALIGRFTLGEPLPARRLASCAVVGLGAVLLGVQS